MKKTIRMFLFSFVASLVLAPAAFAEDSVTFTLFTPRYFLDTTMVAGSPAFILGDRGSFTSFASSPAQSQYVVDSSKLSASHPGYYVSKWLLSTSWGAGLGGTEIQTQTGGTSFWVTFDYKWAKSFGTALDLTVYLSQMRYSLDYDVDGGKWTGTEPAVGPWVYSKGDAAPAEEAISRAGHSLAGWKSSTGKTIAPGESFTGETLGVTSDGQEIVLKAQWSACSYPVTLHKNGGTCSDLTTYTYGVGATLPTATKEGHDFGGWYANADFSGGAVTAISKTDTGAKEFYAKFTPVKYGLRLEMGTGIAKIHYKTGDMAYYDETTSSRTVQVAYGSTWSAYAEVSAGCSSNATCAANGTMGTGGARFAPTATPNPYGLTLTLGQGVAAIYYKTNATAQYVVTDRDITVPVLFGATWSAYATSKPGYAYTKTSELIPATGTMGTGGAKFEPTATPNLVYVRYERNGGTDGSMSDDAFTYDQPAPLKLNSYALRYDVHYEANGGTSHENDVAVYKFDGWNDRADGKGEYSYANGQQVVNPCGSTGAPAINPVLLFAQWEPVPIELPNSSRAGYDLVGWYTAQTGGTRVGGARDPFCPTGYTTLYAHWARHTCTVTFQTDTGSVPAGQETRAVVYGDKYGDYGELPVPVCADPAKRFLGWFTAAEGGTQITGESEVVLTAATATLYARWEDVTCKITYERNGGTIDGAYPESYVPGKTTVWLPTEVTKANATFAGWYDNERFYGEPVTEIGRDATGDKTFWAKWEGNAVKIVYADGVAYTNSYAYGTKDVTLEGPLYSREGYAQAGWAEGKECYELGANIGTLTGDRTFTPTWTTNAYTISFDGNGSTAGEMQSTNAVYGVAMALPESRYEKSGSTFGGWALKPNGAAVFADQAVVSNLTAKAGAAVTLYAVWNAIGPGPGAKHYTIRFSPGADVLNPTAMPDIANCVEGIAINLPECVYTNLASTGFYRWEYHSEPFVVGGAFNPEILFDGQIITVHATWGEAGSLSDAVGLTNAVLEEVEISEGAPTWDTSDNKGREGGSCLMCDFNSNAVTNALRMRVQGPGTVTYWWQRNSFAGKYSKAAIDAGDGVWQSITNKTVYYESKSIEVADGAQDVTWYLYDRSTTQSCQYYLDDVRWTPSFTNRYDIATTAEPAEGGVVTGGGTVDVGKTVELTATPNKGYTFVQWSDGDTNATRTVTVWGDMTNYVAQFSAGAAPQVGHYVVVFDGNGATTGAMPDQTNVCGVATALNPNAFERTGHSFGGWRDAKGALHSDEDVVTDLAPTNQSALLRVLWVPNAYTVRFEANGGSGSMDDLGCRYAESVQLPPNKFARMGFAFGGWTNAVGKVYADGEIVRNLTDEADATVTLYAVWSKAGAMAVRVTLSGATATKHYTGTPLSVEGYQIDEIWYYDQPTPADPYKACDFVLADGVLAQAVGTAVGTYKMGLTRDSFVNRNGSFDVEFVIAADGKLTIGSSRIGGEPGSGAVPAGGISKFDTEGRFDGEFDGTAISNEFVRAGYDIEKIEYAALEAGPWSAVAPTFTAIGTMSVWYKVTAANYEPFVHELLVTVLEGRMEDPELPAQVFPYDGRPHAFNGTAVTNAFSCYAPTEIDYSATSAGPWGQTAPSLTDAGTTQAWYRVRKSNYEDFLKAVPLTVTPRDLAKVAVAPIPDQAWTGSPITPQVTVTDGNPSIVTANDYDVAYSDNVEIGVATVTLTGKRNYTGTKAVHFEIVPKVLKRTRVTITGHTVTAAYDGKAHTASDYGFVSTHAEYTAADFQCTAWTSATRTELGTTFANLTAADFVNLNDDFAAEFVVARDISVTVKPGTIPGEPGAGKVPSGGLSKYDVTTVYDGEDHTLNAEALTNAFAAATYVVTNIEYAATAGGPWTVKPPAISDAGATSFWYRVSCENYEPFAHQAKVTVTPCATVTISITGHVATNVYDGTSHRVEGYDVSIVGSPLYGEDDFAFTGRDYAERTKPGVTHYEMKVADFRNVNGNFKDVKFVIVRDGESVVVWDEPPEGVGEVGRYYGYTLVELGYDVTDAISVKAEGLPAGLALKKGSINGYWYIEGVPTATASTNDGQCAYLCITRKVGTAKAEEIVALPIEVREAHVREIDPPAVLDKAYGPTPIDELWPEVEEAVTVASKDWVFTGWPTGIKYTTRDVAGQAEAYEVYGKATKAGVFTVTATRTVLSLFTTAKFKEKYYASFMTEPKAGEGIAYTSRAYVAIDSVAWRDVKSVSGLPTGLKCGSVKGGVEVYGTPTKAGCFVVTRTYADRTRDTILWQVLPGENGGVIVDFGESEVEQGVVQVELGLPVVWEVAVAEENAKVTVSGLPTGLRYGKVKVEGEGDVMAVYGVPTRAANYTVTVKTVVNGVTVTQRFAVKATALPTYMVGTYYGAATNVLGTAEQFTLTLAATGKVSGNFYVQGKRIAFSAASLERRDVGGRYIAEIAYKYDGVLYADKLVLATTNAVAGVDLWQVSLVEPDGILVGVDAQRDVVKAAGGAPAGNNYTVMVKTAKGEFLNAKVTAAGVVTVSGKLLNEATGKLVSVSCSTHLMVLDEDRFGCWITIYKKVGTAEIKYVRFWELD